MLNQATYVRISHSTASAGAAILPLRIIFRPRMAPESLVIGATPASAAIARSR